MRIVQLANFHSPLSGGIRTTLSRWREGYLRRGHEVHLIAPGDVNRTRERDDGVIHTIAAPLIPGSEGYRLIVTVGRVERLLDRIAPDAIEVSDRTTLVGLAEWARRRSARSTLVLHERLDNQVGALTPSWLPHRRMVDRWNRRTVVAYDGVVATSAYGAREMARIGVSTVRVPLGVDTEIFRPLDAPVSRPRRRLVFLGRLSRDKRPDLALGAARILLSWGHDIELLFIGAGPLRPGLARDSRGLPVSFTGYVSDRHHVSSLLAGADVSIVPCPGECFGLAALESMATGTPVVVAENSGAAELISRGGGIAVPPGPRGFASAIETLLDDPSGEGARAREIALGYPWERSVESMLDLHRGAVVGT